MTAWRKTIAAATIVLASMAGQLVLNPGAMLAAPLYQQPFNTDAGSLASFTATYPGFTTATATTLDVAGGVIHTTGPATLMRAGVGQEVLIRGDIGAQVSNGVWNLGMQIGDKRMLFHPGFAGGAFRVQGVTGNIDMGYTPANGVLHHFQIVQFAGGLISITITDGANPSNVFTTSFVNSSIFGGDYGFFSEDGGSPPNNQAWFDNLVLEYAAQATSSSSPIVFSAGPPGPVTLGNAVSIQNTGVTNSTLQIQSFSITGADAAQFSVPDFSMPSLVAGGSDTVLFDVTALRTGVSGLSALLTINTNIGSLVYDLQVEAFQIPEPSTWTLLATGSAALTWHRKRRRRRSPA